MPLQLFPAVRILENGIFTRSGKADSKVKWLKNCFRFGMVAICTIISWLGAADLDKFVAFVGSFAWYELYAFSSFFMLIFPFKRAAVLCISCNVALQGLCTYTKAETGRYCNDCLWPGCRRIYDHSNYSSLSFFKFSIFLLLTKDNS